jgi:hypothetical protein
VGEAYRRIGVWAFEKCHQFRRNLPVMIAVKRQSDFQRAETPIRFPTPAHFQLNPLGRAALAILGRCSLDPYQHRSSLASSKIANSATAPLYRPRTWCANLRVGEITGRGVGLRRAQSSRLAESALKTRETVPTRARPRKGGRRGLSACQSVSRRLPVGVLRHHIRRLSLVLRLLS